MGKKSEILKKKIPDYYGYEDKLNRHKSDKVIRMYLVKQFGTIKVLLDEITVELSDSGNFHLLKKLGTLAKGVEETTDKLKFASYNYAGLLDSDKVNASDIESMEDTDISLVDNIDELVSVVKKLGTSIDSNTRADDLFSNLESMLNSFNEKLNKRETLMKKE